DPIAIAGKARNYGLHTEASHRFERGVDWQLPRQAMERLTALVVEPVGGEPGPVIEAVAETQRPTPVSIRLRNERVSQMRGLQISEEEIEGYLRGLERGVVRAGAGEWQVEVPSHRLDITLEIDLIEELARLYGYNR